MAVLGSLNVSLRKTTTDDNWHCEESFDLPERQKKSVGAGTGAECFSEMMRNRMKRVSHFLLQRENRVPVMFSANNCQGPYTKAVWVESSTSQPSNSIDLFPLHPVRVAQVSSTLKSLHPKLTAPIPVGNVFWVLTQSSLAIDPATKYRD